eukprot:TRINITY_DN649_c0_g1_i16.p1 TRINITY_DN649_c0_g1~~TRINITY_DN649_c0_g1_i16.p1  ORF type:complete len:591 (+),score=125.15 TRINITY_DN649_c0_g1_i16:201-1973(+)
MFSGSKLLRAGGLGHGGNSGDGGAGGYTLVSNAKCTSITSPTGQHESSTVSPYVATLVDGGFDENMRCNHKRCFSSKDLSLTIAAARTHCAGLTPPQAVAIAESSHTVSIMRSMATTTGSFTIDREEFGEDNWKQSDGSNVIYSPWCANEPSNNGGDENRAHIYTDQGCINDITTAATMRPMCQKPISDVKCLWQGQGSTNGYMLSETQVACPQPPIYDEIASGKTLEIAVGGAIVAEQKVFLHREYPIAMFHDNFDDFNDQTYSGGSRIVNEYYKVQSTTEPEDTTINVVSNSPALVAGDYILIHQTQDQRYANSGITRSSSAWTTARIKSVTGTTLTLDRRVGYTFQGNDAQIVKFAVYKKLTLTNGAVITAKSFDGTGGGIVAIRAREVSISFNSRIDVVGKGFRGGADPTGNNAGKRGEGQPGISGSTTTGANGVGGGGGSSNAKPGSGGGGSGGPGVGAVGSSGGTQIANSGGLSLGGGGGSGGQTVEGGGGRGGNGGGAVLIIADEVTNSGKIDADGENGPCGSQTCGGGGGGGTVYIQGEVSTSLTIETSKGIGSNGAGNGGDGSYSHSVIKTASHTGKLWAR